MVITVIPLAHIVPKSGATGLTQTIFRSSENLWMFSECLIDAQRAYCFSQNWLNEALGGTFWRGGGQKCAAERKQIFLLSALGSKSRRAHNGTQILTLLAFYSGLSAIKAQN